MEALHKRLGISRSEAGEMLDTVLSAINEALQKEKEVKISSFGTFLVRLKKPRIGRNPKTKQEAPIDARNAVSFYASNLLKKRIHNAHI